MAPREAVRVNMRCGVPLAFGSAESEREYLLEVERLRATLTPGEVVVAPRVTLPRTRTGTRQAGDRVQPQDLLDVVDPITGDVLEVGPVRFRRLLITGALIEAW